MTKKEFIDKFATQNQITQKEGAKYIDSFLNILENTLVEGEIISFVGFGKFEPIQKEERKGRNPQTGEEIKIAAKKVIKFKSGTALNEKLNEAKDKKKKK